jgi:hypothetical protein
MPSADGIAAPTSATRHEREHRRQAARDRIDEAQLIAAVRRGEERDVRELQGGRGDDERDRRALHPPRERGRHDQRRHQRQQRDRRGRLRVPLACQQEVPERVQRGGAERQRQRVERHAGDRTIGACT